MNKKTKATEPSLEDRLRSIKKLYDDAIICSIIITADDQLIIGRVAGMKALKFERDAEVDDEDEAELDIRKEINPLSMNIERPDYFG